MTQRQVVIPDWPWNEPVGIAQAVRMENTVYVSGQAARDPDGNIIGRGSTLEQARQVFRNIEEVLGLAGASMKDVVKVTAYFTPDAVFAEYAQARREFLSPLTFAATGVTVAALADPGMLLEVESVAIIGS